MARQRGVVGSARYAAEYPERARRYLHRLRRDVTLGIRHRGDHIAYYGAQFMDDWERLGHSQSTIRVTRS